MHRKYFRLIVKMGIIFSILALTVICSTFLFLNPKLPSIHDLRESKLQIPLRIYTEEGHFIGEFGEKIRRPISINDVPNNFINAILAAEDDRFLKHQGVDLGGLFRAAFELISSGEIKSGGSTITMQVARNFFLTREKSFLRKINEIFLALKIERSLTKNEILELYINKIYLGKRAYGVQAAANIYYGKDINQLNLAQFAMIAGLPKAPSSFNPINNPSRAKIRRDWILGRMFKLNFIPETEYNSAKSSPISAKYYGSILDFNAAYASEMARRIAVQELGSKAYTGGYNIYTTINLKQQRSAKNAVLKGIFDYDSRHGYRGPEASLGRGNKSLWHKTLDNLEIFNNLIPGVIVGFGQKPFFKENHEEFFLVSKIKDEQNDLQSPTNQKTNNHIYLLLEKNKLISFEWNKKTNPLRKYITENKQGPLINDISEILNIGDVIRIKLNPKTHQIKISQLPNINASLVALEPTNGAIRAIVGGFNFKTSKFNRATQAYRQTGSNLKPFIYAAALENGFSAASIINDAPLVFTDKKLEADWRPENSGGVFNGPTTLRRALYQSQNLVSIRLLRELGIGNTVNYLKSFEFNNKEIPKDLSLALGSFSMTPLQLAKGYSVIANGGFLIAPFIVDYITDRKGSVIFQSSRFIACSKCDEDENNIEAESLDDIINQENSHVKNAIRIMDERVAYIIDSILKDVIKKGTGRKALQLRRVDIAGKTGTTNGPTDAWFSGYHPDLATTTWLGFDSNKKIGKKEYGGSAALPIWIDFMKDQLKILEKKNKIRPKGIVSVKVNQPGGSKQNVKEFELFLEELQPTKSNSIEKYMKSNDQEINGDLF